MNFRNMNSDAGHDFAMPHDGGHEMHGMPGGHGHRGHNRDEHHMRGGFGADGRGGRRGERGPRGDRNDFGHDEGRGFGGMPFGPGGFGQGGFGPGGERGMGRGLGRGRRGDVRAAIIALLGEQPMNGYQLIHAIDEKSEGLWSPKAGSIYPALGLLEDEGLIAPIEDDGKKLFTLTDEGKKYAEEHADEVTAPWDRVAGPHKGKLTLMPELRQLGMAIQQVVVAGDSGQIEAARGILEKSRRDIYRLLAGDMTAE